MKENFNDFNKILLIVLSVFYWLSKIVAQQEWRVPDMPENVQWKTDESTVTIWWDPPATVDEILVRGYTIAYGIGTPNRRVVIEGTNTNAYTIKKLKSNTTYVFALTAYNEADGEDSEKVLFTATTKVKEGSDEQLINLQAPTNINAKAISPTEIAIKWTDPNDDIYDDHPSESIRSLFRGRKYMIQYGEYKSLNLEKITTIEPYAILENLQPSTNYEFVVKVILPNGIESAWTTREIIKTPFNVASMKELELLDLQFNFEQPEKCFFYSDPTAPLQWKAIDAKNYDELSDRKGKYFVNLQSTIFDNNYGHLISTPIILNESNYCLSAWIYVRQFSKGILSVQLLSKEKNYDSGNVLFVEKLQKIPRNQWHHLFWDFLNSGDIFQISFKVTKEKGDQFWLAFDDIRLHHGNCDKESGVFLNDSERFEC